MTGTILERYQAKVARGGPDECWLWNASRDRKGYGKFGLGTGLGWKPAHRVGYGLLVGPIPEALIVRHTCDNPPCQNPAHWLLGTPADNTADMLSRRREARGERHGQSKLTQAQVDEMRSAVGLSQRALAARYGVTQQTVCDVLRRRLWP